MKKVLLASLAMAFVLAAFTACNDGGDDGERKDIESGVVVGTEDVVTVVAVYDNDEKTIMSRVDFKNGKFALDLPVTVSESLLETKTAEDFDLAQDATMIPSEFKSMSIDFYGQNADDVDVGYFIFNSDINEEDYGVEAVWVYSDSAVTIESEYTDTTGAEDYQSVYDVRLKKGWNVIYYVFEWIPGEGTAKDKEYYLATTVKPDVDMDWYFIGNFGRR